jgi:hypothetical protein
MLNLLAYVKNHRDYFCSFKLPEQPVESQLSIAIHPGLFKIEIRHKMISFINYIAYM